MAKITKIERATRINEIYKLLIVGASRPAILQYAAKTLGEISDRSVDSYMADVRKLMVSELQEDRQIALAEEIELRRFIIQKALADKKYQTALSAADSKAKLLGLFDSLDRALNIVMAYGFTVVDSRDAQQNQVIANDNPALAFADILGVSDEIEPVIIPNANRNLEEILARG